MSININKNYASIILSWTAVLLWMLLIFYSSAQVAEQSNQLSKGVTAVIIGFVERIALGLELNTNTFNYIVRKNAHFFTYLILSVFVMNAIRKSRVEGSKGILITFGICVLYAVSDEVHQLFVPGRSGQMTDVFIDGSGAVLGLVIVQLLSLLRKKEMGRGEGGKQGQVPYPKFPQEKGTKQKT